MAHTLKVLPLCFLVACAGRAPPTTQPRVTICTARALGAIPDDGIDDRAGLQAALAGGCADTLEAGTYQVATPVWPRAWWSLQMPADSTLAGVGDATVIRCTGADMDHDWRCIEAGDRTHITRLRIEVRLDATKNEQTHAIRITGPRTSVRIDHVTIDHPVVAGSSMGDCIQVVGGPGAEAVDVTIDHNAFQACARSGVAIHSGLRGFAITSNHFVAISDQDIDEEGSGGIVNGEIAWNTFDLPPAPLQSSLSVSIMSATGQHIHDNVWNGRGLDLYGCSGCELDHNVITQTAPTADAVVEVRKTSHVVSIHDETYTRAASAGPGGVVSVLERITAPDHVTIRDTKLHQHTAAPAIGAAGIIGLVIERVTMDGDKPYPVAIDLQGTAKITTTDLHVIDSTITGPWTTAIRITGSYAGGAGTLEVARVEAVGVSRGLVCENIKHSVSASGYVIGGITGPVTYAANSMPGPLCGELIATPSIAARPPRPRIQR